MKRLLASVCAAFALAVAGAADRDAPVWFLKVQSAPGEIETQKSGGVRLNGIGSCCRASSSSNNSYTKRTTTTLRWKAEVRLRGKSEPKKVELRAFYVGNRGESTVPVILKQEVKPIALDADGTGEVELVSPTTTQTRSRQSASRGNTTGFVRTTSTVRGERMAGCVVQLVVDGQVTKVWSSVSAWTKKAWDDPFTQQSLVRKSKNALN